MSNQGTNDVSPGVSRRGMLGLCLGVAGAGLIAALGLGPVVGEDLLMSSTKQSRESPDFSNGRVTARPRQVKTAAPKGLQELKLEGGRDGFIYVPAAYSQERPAPLVLMLHGAGGNARHSVPLLQDFADKAGV